jgi:hypothetical protein
MTFTVPGYRVDRLLGAGSQGEVWLGEQLASGERVALKRIPAESPAAAAAARAEAALLAALDHPSLIALRAFVPMDSAMVLVLELAEAGTLAGLLRRRGRLTPPEVVATISPVAAALAHAHATGVLHGDVSAANILFNAAGYPKLADLGLARMLAAAADPPLGTPAYLDPTIAAGGPAGLASDVFSLAAVAPGMAEVLVRALAVEPQRRGSAAELALDLRAALPPAPVTLAGGRIVEPVGRHSAERFAGSAGAVRLMATGTGGGRVSPGDPSATGLSFVPVDLTRIAPVRPPADIAAALRTGGLAGAELGDPVRPGWRSRAVRARPIMRFRAPILRFRLPTMRFRVPAIRLGRPTRVIAMLLVSALIGAALVLGWPELHRRPAAAETGLAGAELVAHGPFGTGSSGTAGLSPPDDAFSTAGRSGTAGARPPAAGPTVGAPAAALTTERLAAVLGALDSVRERAFAERRPELLTQVYASPALLAADTAQLTSTVPAGCGLVGVRTDYRSPELAAPVGSAPAGSVAVTVTATLSPATLSCAGLMRSRTRPAGPTTLRLLLVDSGGGWRIASQRLG